MTKNPLQRLSDFGQSVWNDNLSRNMIESGELQRLIDEDGVVGITSNPTIFDSAISETADYDDQIRKLIVDGRDTNEIYEHLVVTDIQDACDILRPVYRRTNGLDGYVSLEVSPFLAFDTEKTIEEARRLFNMVNRPNVFIKIPGTEAGVPAIEQMLYEGVNINITLLFSLDAYRAVMEAYLRAMERRIDEGKRVDNIASVASFFVSRVDSEVDKRLQAIIDERPDSEKAKLARALLGTVAIANARLAYQEFKRVFNSDRFGQIAGRGARIQRPLWASTSTKNPDYPDTLYVDELIGPNTVETLAPASIDAFREGGTVQPTLEKDVATAREILDNMEALGIRYDDVTNTLVEEGVEKFADSFRSLMHHLEEKCERFTGELQQQRREQLGPMADATDREIKELEGKDAVTRLSAMDPSFWSDNADQQKSIANRLGWLATIADMRQQAAAGLFRSFAGEVNTRGYDRVILLGMGGSSLAPEVMSAIFGAQEGFPELTVLDSTNPDTISRIAKQTQDEYTLYIVSSKSGGTVETRSLFDYFLDQHDGVAADFVVITDPGTPLEAEARRIGCWKVFTNRHDIGGRYSALSFFGLIPAAAIGIDVDQILEDAASMLPLHNSIHAGIWLGAAIGAAQKAGRDKLTILAPDEWQALGDWLEQLIAESTNKQGIGVIPVVHEESQAPGSYDEDRIFVQAGPTGIELTDFAQKLHSAGQPVVNLPMSLGQQFITWEIAIAVAGERMAINPFNEPNVQEAKDQTNAVLKNPSSAPVSGMDGTAAIEQLLSSAKTGDYLAIMAYVDRTADVEQALEELRSAIGRQTGLATTLGYGPRFLHSTGQLHKGGAPNGVFLQIVQQPETDVDVPEHDYTFKQLFAAQSAGDFLALQQHERRVARVETGSDAAAVIRSMAEVTSSVANVAAGQ